MTANPVDLVYVDGVPVAKADVRGYEKLRVRKYMANPDEVRNTDLSGQYAGVYVRSIQSFFDLDTSDTTSADDGVNCIIDLAGNRFKLVSVGSGSSSPRAQRKVTAAGDITGLAGDEIVVVAKTVGAATNYNMPTSVGRTKPLTVTDGKYDAATNNITLVQNGSETIMGATSYIIDGNGGSITLTPLADGSGWVSGT